MFIMNIIRCLYDNIIIIHILTNYFSNYINYRQILDVLKCILMCYEWMYFCSLTQTFQQNQNRFKVFAIFLSFDLYLSNMWNTYSHL